MGKCTWRRAETPPMADSLSLPPPEPLARQAGAFSQRLELGPDNRRVYLGRVRRLGREAAVAARYHVLAPHQIRIRHQEVGDQLRVLDDIARVGHHPWDKDRPVGRLDG